MTKTCTLTPSGRSFPVDDGETLLAAALRAGVVLPYGCKDGACGSCKATLVAGAVDHGHYQKKALSDADRDAGGLLLCQATAETDITVSARVVAAEGMIPIRKLPCRVASIERAATDVAIVKLQLPAAEKFDFLAGQIPTGTTSTAAAKAKETETTATTKSDDHGNCDGDNGGNGNDLTPVGLANALRRKNVNSGHRLPF
jgi:ferredoxin